MNRAMSLAAYSFLGVLMLIMMTGCTNGSKNNSDPKPSITSEKVRLKVVQSLTNPKRTERLQILIKGFESQYPNIRVELVSPVYDKADETILSMLESERDIDIVEVRDITVHNYSSRGLILSLETLLTEWGNYGQLSDNAKLAARNYENIAYYMPSTFYQSQLYYRKDWFDAKALQVPETWEDIYYVGKQLTKPEIGQYGYAFRGGSGAAVNLTRIIQDYNSVNVNPQDSMFRIDGDTIFSDPKAVEALNLYRKLALEISPPDAINWSFHDQVNAFINGQTAMLIQDSDVIDIFSEKLKEGTWATAPLPTGSEGVSHSNVGATGWGIAQQSKHKDEAWALITYLSSESNNEFFAQATGAISIYSSTDDQDIYSIGPYMPYTLMQNNPDKFKSVKSAYNYSNYDTYFKMATELGRNYIVGKMTAEELLEQFNDFWVEQRASLVLR